MAHLGGSGDRGGGEDFSFASRYEPRSLLADPLVRRRFFADVLAWEGRFMRPGVGVSEGGLTFDGAHIGEDSQLTPRTHSNPSKESLHIALLSLAASGDGLARQLFSREEALRQLEGKAAALEAQRGAAPQLHGFMPWFDAQAGGIALEPEVAVRYNGMLAWALYFAERALEDVGETSLAQRFGEHLREMQKWAVSLSYKGAGKIAARITMRPREDTPVQSEQNCDDPFAGELFSFFLDLLADWEGRSASERDEIWADAGRRRWLATAVLDLRAEGLPDAEGPLEALLHGTFSAHEEWKHLLLPYSALPASRRLSLMAEKVRCRYARAHGLPGLLGDCHVPVDWRLRGETEHVTRFGIPGVSSLRAEDARRDAVATSGTFGLLLADPAAGAVWLHSTLSGEGMQTPWGAAESCRADGAASCQLLTWDAKATVALAILGGLGPRMRRYLERDGLLPRFAAIVEGLYGDLAPGGALLGELAAVALPAGVDAAPDAEEMLSVDLEMVRACRDVSLPQADARRLGPVREWFEGHQAEACNEQYCLPLHFEDWCTTSGGRYAADETGRESLYLHIVAMFDLGIPLVLLVRQPPLYPLFFDLDIYGGFADEEAADRVQQLAWEDDDQVLARAIVTAVLRLYPQFSSSLELAVFGCSGPCRHNGRFKASYHLVFPQIIVDRPVKAWPNGPSGSISAVPGRHMAVRDHVVCCLTDESEEGGPLSELREDLFRCCDALVENEGEEEEEGSCDMSTECSAELDAAADGPPVYLNDWTEILDDKPLRHEPWPEAATGFRLPFTDKAVHGALEGRPKLPLGLWEFGLGAGEVPRAAAAASLRSRRLPEPEPASWVRLGDLAACRAEAPTPWEPSALHVGVQEAAV